MSVIADESRRKGESAGGGEVVCEVRVGLPGGSGGDQGGEACAKQVGKACAVQAGNQAREACTKRVAGEFGEFPGMEVECQMAVAGQCGAECKGEKRRGQMLPGEPEEREAAEGGDGSGDAPKAIFETWGAAEVQIVVASGEPGGIVGGIIRVARVVQPACRGFSHSGAPESPDGLPAGFLQKHPGTRGVFAGKVAMSPAVGCDFVRVGDAAHHVGSLAGIGAGGEECGAGTELGAEGFHDMKPLRGQRDLAVPGERNAILDWGVEFLDVKTQQQDAFFHRHLWHPASGYSPDKPA